MSAHTLAKNVIQLCVRMVHGHEFGYNKLNEYSNYTILNRFLAQLRMCVLVAHEFFSDFVYFLLVSAKLTSPVATERFDRKITESRRHYSSYVAWIYTPFSFSRYLPQQRKHKSNFKCTKIFYGILLVVSLFPLSSDEEKKLSNDYKLFLLIFNFASVAVRRLFPFYGISH